MQLSTSDWVTIIATVVSVLSSAAVAVGVAIWQVRKTSTAQITKVAPDPVFTADTRKWLVAQLWPFVTTFVLGLILVVGSLLTDGPVTRSFVISFVCGGFLLAFSVVCSAVLFVAAAFRPAYFALQRIYSKSGTTIGNKLSNGPSAGT